MSNRALPSANASRSVKPGMGGGGVAKKPTPTPTTSSSSSNNKKVDIIHTSDEDTETEEDEPTFIKNEDLNENDKRTLEEKNAPQADELLRTKRPRNMKPFTEDLLTNPHGLSRIYHEFPLNAKFTSRGSEAIYLQRLITMYKGWAFQLHPGVSFQDVLLKCETLGSKSKIRQTLTMMRERERERYIVSKNTNLLYSS